MDILRCAAQHFGFWAVEPYWISSAVSAVISGTWKPVAATPRDPGADLYSVDHAGLAVIPISGQITKGRSSYGGTSSVETRMALRQAVQDKSVRGVMLAIDSPGGSVAGTAELARDVRRTHLEKPVYAHIDDLGASAAYWIASQAGKITASPTSEVGSIGTLAIIEDLSGRAEAEGIKVHVVAAGAHKGDLVPGTEVTEDQLSEVRERVDALNGHFLSDVAAGRGASDATVDAWADGRVHIAAKAQELGLIDAVESFDSAIDSFRDEIRPRRNMRSAIAIAEASLKL